MSVNPSWPYPFAPEELARKKRALKRQLLERTDGQTLIKRVAVLGGSTTAEIKDQLEVLLLSKGITPQFFESEYNKYYEDVVFENPELYAFKPEIVFIHTSYVNLRLPNIGNTPAEIEQLFESQKNSWIDFWNRISNRLHAVIVQNNFDFPPYRVLGNLDAWDPRGAVSFISRMNAEMANYARANSGFCINDINYLSAQVGLDTWHNPAHWYQYKYAVSLDAIPFLAHSAASLISAVYGKTKKCLVLDLDNTVWGGEIGEAGIQGIALGNDNPNGMAYLEFQKYCRSLKERGIILAVCSKNDVINAKSGFEHPDTILNLQDFAAFKANWEPKSQNIRDIAFALNIGKDSMVFLDDSTFEREIVRAQSPEVTVPEFGNDVSQYRRILDRSLHFETVALSADDLKRAQMYAANTERDLLQSQVGNYEDFLASLKMSASIRGFEPLYLDRITQLINKTNQFNLTTQRMTQTEVEGAMHSPQYISLYGRLKDRFGDSGLVTVALGEIAGEELSIKLWLMSCRVLKRHLEYAMMDELIRRAKARGVKSITGQFLKTKKNNMVTEFYAQFGFEKIQTFENGDATWRLHDIQSYQPKNQFITIEE